MTSSSFVFAGIKLKERPVSISRLREDVLCPSVGDPAGNGTKVRRHCAWSSGGRYLAVNSVLAPAAVWIWNIPDGFVLNAVIVLSDRLLGRYCCCVVLLSLFVPKLPT